MNRTLLLILCDFLLLTLLALTRWETAEPPRPAETGPNAADEDAVTAVDDMVELMRLSLEDQQSAQADLQAEQMALEAELSSREEQLAARERSLEELQTTREALARALDEQRATAVSLRSQVQSAVQTAAASRERIDQLQRDLERRETEAIERESELAALTQQQEEARARIQTLDVAVRVAEQEKAILRETAETFRTQAEVERQERLKVQETTVQLAEDVGQLAEKSAAITQEIRDYRPINANILFSEYLANRVPVYYRAAREGLLGPVTRNSTAETVLVTDGQDTFALMHIEDTPFNLYEPASNWSRLEATLRKREFQTAAGEVRFLRRDPRVVALPLNAFEASSFGVQVYKTALDPFRFAEAVLIGSDGKGYGEVPFKLDPDTRGYVHMNDRLVRRLFGDYTPARGDLVLSKSGELLGVMVSPSLCAMVDTFLAEATIQTGDTTGQDTKGILEALQNRVNRRVVTPRGR